VCECVCARVFMDRMTEMPEGEDWLVLPAKSPWKSLPREVGGGRWWWGCGKGLPGCARWPGLLVCVAAWVDTFYARIAIRGQHQGELFALLR